jgi:hypothetical protein
LAGLRLVVVGGLQRQQVAGEPVAQVVLHVGADPAGDVAAQAARGPADQGQEHQQADLAAEDARHPPGQPLVDDRPDDQRDDGGDAHHGGAEDERHRHPPPVGA